MFLEDCPIESGYEGAGVNPRLVGLSGGSPLRGKIPAPVMVFFEHFLPLRRERRTGWSRDDQ